MAEQGGYRKPEMPAAVSGPGKYSARTDGQPGTTPKQAARYVSGLPQGEGKAFNEEVVGAAPMTAAPSVPTAPAPTPEQSMPLPDMPSDLFAPTARPDEPLTTGVDVGAGAGSEVLKYQQKQQQELDSDYRKAAQIRNLLEKRIDDGDTSNATRQLVRKLRAMNLGGEA